jgi:hypothetical protein
VAKKIPLRPAHPERVCWGCDRYCPANSLSCGNGSERAQHPCELFGDDWMTWELAVTVAVTAAVPEAEPRQTARTAPGEQKS